MDTAEKSGLGESTVHGVIRLFMTPFWLNMVTSFNFLLGTA